MKSIGILGGGQLSLFLSLKAKTLDLKVFVLSKSALDPASQNRSLWIKGDPRQLKDLQNFSSLVDIITFESEFFSTKTIEKALEGIRGKKPYIAPSLKALSLIQDRWAQKKLLKQYKIKTAEFINVRGEGENKNRFLKIWDKFGPFVLKTRQGGYDGYGTFIVKKKNQIQNFSSHSLIAEKFMPFQRELALLAARNKKGQIVFFPLVESFQKNSRCLWVKGPVQHKDLKT